MLKHKNAVRGKAAMINDVLKEMLAFGMYATVVSYNDLHI